MGDRCRFLCDPLPLMCLKKEALLFHLPPSIFNLPPLFLSMVAMQTTTHR